MLSDIHSAIGLKALARVIKGHGSTITTFITRADPIEKTFGKIS